ncbi:uncharacterized protein B0I36DRAFT_426757 [Microdochium trichocladiopsis]|uniref:Uncharacterized protein n=1 Tax=Microdochium trichocladiopsis TaxID=1682393 RepID=A0A9P8YJP1_9PEZI|nr:uncharacterized protein B0I36DRAFT_426757 [Microdochium trichocladiopsis]KAH7040270.1 hypothetical protein B0I36DRAFT_426757 [Microdochium trichocladiopsis]
MLSQDLIHLNSVARRIAIPQIRVVHKTVHARSPDAIWTFLAGPTRPARKYPRESHFRCDWPRSARLSDFSEIAVLAVGLRTRFQIPKYAARVLHGKPPAIGNPASDVRKIALQVRNSPTGIQVLRATTCPPSAKSASHMDGAVYQNSPQLAFRFTHPVWQRLVIRPRHLAPRPSFPHLSLPSAEPPLLENELPISAHVQADASAMPVFFGLRELRTTLSHGVQIESQENCYFWVA